MYNSSEIIILTYREKKKIYRVNVTLVSVIEMGIQVFFCIERLAAQAASPLRRPVLMFRPLLGPKNVSTFVERTLQRQLYLMLLQDWHPSLKPREC